MTVRRPKSPKGKSTKGKSTKGKSTKGKSTKGKSPKGLARPNEPAVLILTSLAAGPKHGYALAKDIEEFAGAALGPGTLYGAITRLDGLGLIEAVDGDPRRRPYRLTSAGRAELARIVHEMRDLADEGASRLGLASRRRVAWT